MGLFDFLKKDKTVAATDNGIKGPSYLEGFTEHIVNPNGIKNFEWRRKLKSRTGQTKFQIRFYGEVHPDHPRLVMGTAAAPLLVIAVDIVTGEEILLFDGCKHGYNAQFAEAFTAAQINRTATKLYAIDSKQNFEIIISAYYQINYEDPEEDFLSEVDENGFIELEDGNKVEFEIARRNGFDVFQIIAVDADGEQHEVVSEELA